MHTVLIVEDEKLIRQGIRTMIQRSGVPVDNIMECNNGQTALEILESQKVDVMFTDIRMPKMDGIELVRKMQELPQKPLTVAVSGYDDFSYAVEMLRNGVREYILKPVDREKLKEVLLKLEKELLEEQENHAHFKVIGCQQMKRAMLADSAAEKEMEIFRKSMEDTLLYPEYYVCCLETNSGEAEDSDTYLYLGDTGGSCVYLTNRENCRFLLKNELRDSYVGVSALHHGAEQLRAAYLEALQARKKAFCLCCHSVFTEEEENKREQITEISGLTEGRKDILQDENIHKIVQMLGTDKIKEAIRLTEQFLSRTKRGMYGLDDMEHYMKVLIPDIQTVYQNVLGEQEEALQQFLNPYAFSCMDELLEELTGWMLAFHEKIDTQFEDYGNKQKMQQAVAYIRENYNKDLNMAVVSNFVSMNYSLFSYAFKQYTGKNFVNYLKELRMEEAKRLLVQTQLRVMEISQQVGYENEKHFMKIFKSVYGVSPTEYRKNMEFMKQ